MGENQLRRLFLRQCGRIFHHAGTAVRVGKVRRHTVPRPCVTLLSVWTGVHKRRQPSHCSFVSWCADQCGYLESGIVPKFSLCSDGVDWFNGNGQWQGKDYEPKAGDIIFFDWSNDGQDGDADHVGIVEKCENGVVYTVEGNSGDACRQNSYPIGYYEILGYGCPSY